MIWGAVGQTLGSISIPAPASNLPRPAAPSFPGQRRIAPQVAISPFRPNHPSTKLSNSAHVDLVLSLAAHIEDEDQNRPHLPSSRRIQVVTIPGTMAGKKDRPALNRAKRKTWYAEHHRGLRVVFKEMHIVSKHDPAGLSQKDVVRLIKHAFPGLPKKYYWRHYYDRWSGRFGKKKPLEWRVIDRPNTRNMAPYTQAEVTEFDHIRALFVQAASDLDIDIPWRDNVEEVIEQVADSDDEGNDESEKCDGDARADENMYAHIGGSEEAHNEASDQSQPGSGEGGRSEDKEGGDSAGLHPGSSSTTVTAAAPVSSHHADDRQSVSQLLMQDRNPFEGMVFADSSLVRPSGGIRQCDQGAAELQRLVYPQPDPFVEAYLADIKTTNDRLFKEL